MGGSRCLPRGDSRPVCPGWFLKSVPAGRPGLPEEVAELVLFLLSAKAGYCVGTLMYCDGGLDAQLRGLDWPKVRTPQA